MPLSRIIIKNYKSIKKCDFSLTELNVLIGKNGTGKTTILEAINYFYKNLTKSDIDNSIFNQNNSFSNEISISFIYDLSDFLKIAKSHSGEDDTFDNSNEKKYNGYYKAIISIASLVSDNKIKIEMRQIKGKSIWWNCKYEDRMMLKNLFPIFLINCRSLNLSNWEYIWSFLGELLKVSYDERKNISEDINKILLDSSREISEKLNEVIKIFNTSEISIKKQTGKDYASNLAKIFFSGDYIYQKERKLSYYSTGTNSVKYLEILLKTCSTLARVKMKEPLVLLDEPEISLHTNYIDELSEEITNVYPKLNILIATHSSRLTKNLIISPNSVYLYNVKQIDNATIIYKMKRFPQYSPSSTYKVFDDHINSYFSRFNLFVEGETELELFSNPYLRNLFPILKKIDVFKASSDNVTLNIMDPKLLKNQIPYLCLIDLDKILIYDQDKNTFILNTRSGFLPDKHKELFRYCNKHEYKNYLYFQRHRIDEMVNQLRVHYSRPFFGCNDTNYKTMITLIQKYLISYNVFCLKTTIEGTLINEKTIDFAFKFLIKQSRCSHYKCFTEYYNNLNDLDKLNLLRLLYNGKNDLIGTRKKIFKELSQEEQELLEKFLIGKKTSTWISSYLEQYFKNKTKLNNRLSEKTFRIFLENTENKSNLKKKFEEDFFEIFSLINKVYDMIDS